MYQDIQNKDVLLHISKFFNKHTDKKDIFNLASCNKRINNILKTLISDNYVYVINNYLANNIPTSYKCYRINLPSLYNHYAHITEIPNILMTIDKQIKLNTLESIRINNVFRHETTNKSKCLVLHEYMYDDQHINTIISGIKQCNITINELVILSDKYKNMATIMNNFDKLEYVYMHGYYNNCTANYSFVKDFATTTSSLYLLKNFQNIEHLWLIRNSKLLEFDDEINYTDNLILPNLKVLVIHEGYDIDLDRLLTISPNLKTIYLKTKDWSGIEKYIQEQHGLTSIPLVDIIGPTIYDKQQNHHIYLISGIIRSVLYDNVVTKYPNIKRINVFGHTGKPTDNIPEIIKKVTEKYPQIHKPLVNNLHDILMYAYKIVFMYTIMCHDITVSHHTVTRILSSGWSFIY